MANQNTTTLPLYDKIWLKFTFSRVMDFLTLLLLFLLLSYRVLYYNHTFPWLVALLCESWFTFYSIIVISTKWTPAHAISHLDRLLLQVPELPAVDMFVTTADPELEPPILTVNTVLSLLALDYPAHKLACYVSDDGCSPLTFYALVEASKFAKLWVPFCKKYNVECRAPFRYFCDDETIVNHREDLPEFNEDWLRMKEEYGHLSSKIEKAEKKSIPLEEDFSIFSSAQKRNHSPIIKVIWENKKGVEDVVPHLIYISREKRPQHPHFYKAGAMNVLTRVSGLMTNAPIILNLDCDMFVNNPKIALHAMCILLDPKGEKEVAFVQCPQQFYDGLKDDPFGNQLAAFFVYMGGGLGGLQGMFYVGTNCFHRRKVIYGLCPDHHHIQNTKKDDCATNGKLLQTELEFGNSVRLVESAAYALEGKTFTTNDNLCNSVEAAKEVASCEYEYGTAWGKQIGWVYGSTSEDILTGLTLHTKGWRSEVCSPNPVACMGCSPQDNIVSMTQQKRWATGLGEILLSKHSPIFGTLYGNLQIRECLGYLWLLTWPLRSVPEICYAALPAYCILTNSTFLPQQPGLWIPVALFVVYNMCTLLETLKSGLSIQTWWNNQKMTRITAMNAWFFGFLTLLLKKLRISEPVFHVTKKDQSSISGSGNQNGGRFIFNESPIFLPGTTILLVQLTALVTSLLKWQLTGEVFCSAYLVLCYLPFLKGLFGKGKHGIPLSIICKAAMLASVFVHLCRLSIRG